jgi:hypothetical protein
MACLDFYLGTGKDEEVLQDENKAAMCIYLCQTRFDCLLFTWEQSSSIK